MFLTSFSDGKWHKETKLIEQVCLCHSGTDWLVL